VRLWSYKAIAEERDRSCRSEHRNKVLQVIQKKYLQIKDLPAIRVLREAQDLAELLKLIQTSKADVQEATVAPMKVNKEAEMLKIIEML
jgi:hypothetical protein